MIWQSHVDACAVTSCPSCPNMVNHLNGGSNEGTGLPAGCCVVLHACVSGLITGSCDAIDVFLFKKRKRERAAAFSFRHRGENTGCKKNKTTKSKNPHLYISQVPPVLLRLIPLPPGHLPSPHACSGRGLQCCCITGGASCSLFIVAEGRELAKATLHLSLSPSYRLVRPLTRKRSAPCAPPVFSSPKKGTRAHEARGTDDRNNKNQGRLCQAKKLGTAQQVESIFFFPSFQSMMCVCACASVFCLLGFFFL